MALYLHTLFHVVDESGETLSPDNIILKYGFNTSFPSRIIRAEQISDRFSRSSTPYVYNCSIQLNDPKYEFVRFDAKLYLYNDFPKRTKVEDQKSSSKNPFGTSSSAFNIGITTTSSKPAYVEVWVVLKRTWPITKTVTLDPNGGSVTPTSIECTVGNAYGSLPNPILEGHFFGGWYDGELLIKESSIFTEESSDTLVAHWVDTPPKPIRPDSQRDYIMFGGEGMLVFDTQTGAVVYAV